MPNELIKLDHGAGGGMSQELIGDVIVKTLGEVYVGLMEDSADVPLDTARIAITTDSFVVDPLFFGNGDIGKIAVAGTVNDLAVSGAKPRYLTLALIIEEGFPISDLVRVLESVRATALEAGVLIVAGDTKVVRRGEADGLYINTTGVGLHNRPELRLSSRRLRPGDGVIVTGYLGDHSVHLLSLREGLGFETRVLSDCAPLNGVLADLFDACGAGIRCVRDVTRGGLGTVLNEFAGDSAVDIRLDGSALPIRHETGMAADMLGVDVMYLANEGVLCVVADPTVVPSALDVLRGHETTAKSSLVGEVVAGDGRVWLQDEQGGRSTVDLLYGAQLPRLC
ncbi:hydrogenase expression/formation protein HypE [Streptomyces anulatus]|uniref:hydrogenase expression/formation protein HypE n=1 Tax=Streptomyces anulatus TaxID=1892 RepID=UPI00225C052E|nr:hydrogenase expression/formation protein HypE [Streptomyces anulatus]MCX4502492.1 hydrogenase expression/formation protein HypE [Streptomyces anulatus]WSU78011.1 hydrogenase expression/formation protein HypE [Streptomyces anulatus]